MDTPHYRAASDHQQQKSFIDRSRSRLKPVDAPPEKRVGRDGKARRMSKVTRKAKPEELVAAGLKPTGEARVRSPKENGALAMRDQSPTL